MNKRDLFLILSNSKYQGKKTCEILNNNLSINNLDIKHINLDKIKEEIKRYNISLLDHPFPRIYNPPPFLYALGSGSIRKSVGIIGSRTCSSYGKKAAYDISYELSKRGIQIVSGLAYGIDEIAHRACIDAGGSTIAVLGSGILNCYPKANINLYHKIKENGLIISEHGLYTKPLKYNFPFRNRIISALSDILIVIEAKEKSGTMITVNYALDQGKTVFAVPGSIYSKESKGTNNLINEGANIFTSIEDVLMHL